MSRRRPWSSPILLALACVVALACTPGARASAADLDGYLRCIERERNASGRDAGAFDALLRIERRAICFRLHWPTRDAAAVADQARRAQQTGMCGGVPGWRGQRARQAWERRRALLRVAAEHAQQDASNARAIGVGMAGDDAAYAARVAADLDAQSRTLQRYAELLHPARDAAVAVAGASRGDAVCDDDARGH